MDQSKDHVSLDEKIALIRKKNEMIIKRKQLIEKEIELAKKHNAMVDVCAPKTFEDDKPTLYSDTIPKSRKEERKRTVPDKVNYKPRNSNTREEAAWRAERNEIDRERIRRQKAESGWRREWDADKLVPDDEFLRESCDWRDRSKETSRQRSSHNQSASADRSPVSVRRNEYQTKQSDISAKRSELPAPSQNQHKSQQSEKNVSERPELPAPRQNQTRGRGRPVVSASNAKITPNLRRTVNVEASNVKSEKSPLRKRVSWGTEELIASRRITLKDDHLNNIKVKVNAVDSDASNRSIEITEERGPLMKSANSFKFDEKTSFNIKDCVAKASSNKPRANLPVKDAAPKPKDSFSAKIAPKPIITNRTIIPRREPAPSLVAASEPSSKDEVDTGNDEEWEDVSGEEWESASEEE